MSMLAIQVKMLLTLVLLSTACILSWEWLLAWQAARQIHGRRILLGRAWPWRSSARERSRHFGSWRQDRDDPDE